MPLEICVSDGKPGFRWGRKGKCYTYDPGDDQSRQEAKQKAIRQGIAAEGPARVQRIIANDK